MNIKSTFIVLILGMLVPIKGTADDMQSNNIIESASADCLTFGAEAEAIQMIRGDDGSTIEEIIVNLAAYIESEFEEGMKKQPIYLMQVRAVGKWVYSRFPAEFDPALVGNTYTVECHEKTMAQIEKAFPDLVNGIKDQERRATTNY